uniref:Uncharacterized protein n=1 Tax=Cacopsylla melanoneura TaxID=428564 RepID=A0A8D8UL45_9HEMI
MTVAVIMTRTGDHSTSGPRSGPLVRPTGSGGLMRLSRCPAPGVHGETRRNEKGPQDQARPPEGAEAVPPRGEGLDPLCAMLSACPSLLSTYPKQTCWSCVVATRTCTYRPISSSRRPSGWKRFPRTVRSPCSTPARSM